MSIGDMVHRMVEDREPRLVSDGGIGGLTPAEEAELAKLVNGDGLCECGDCGCGNPIPKPGLR